MKHNRSKVLKTTFPSSRSIYQHCSLQVRDRKWTDSYIHSTRDTRKKLSVCCRRGTERRDKPTTPLTLGGHFSHSGQAKWVRRRLMNPALARHSREPIRGCKYVTALCCDRRFACLNVGWGGFSNLGSGGGCQDSGGPLGGDKSSVVTRVSRRMGVIAVKMEGALLT